MATTCQKAAIGVGLNEGVAEDFGRASAWLARHDIYALPALHQALLSITNNSAVYGQWQRTNAGVKWVSSGVGNRLSAALIGGAAADLYSLEKADEGARVCLSELDIPVLQLAFFAELSRPCCTLIIWNDANTRVEVVLAGCRQWSNVESSLLVGSGSYEFEVTYVTESRLDEVKRRCHLIQESREISLKGFEVHSHHWSDLKSLADLTLVEPSEKSRMSGAGAGLTDND